MTSTIPTERSLVLKTDRLGRVRVPAEQREAILEEFDRSGMTGAAFAEHHGIKYQTFASWRQARNRRRAKAAEANEPIALAEVVVDSSGAAAGESSELRIELPGGAHMQVCSPQQARLAATVLESLQPERVLPC